MQERSDLAALHAQGASFGQIGKFLITIRCGFSLEASGTYFRVSFYMDGARCGLNFADLDKGKLFELPG